MALTEWNDGWEQNDEYRSCPVHFPTSITWLDTACASHVSWTSSVPEARISAVCTVYWPGVFITVYSVHTSRHNHPSSSLTPVHTAPPLSHACVLQPRLIYQLQIAAFKMYRPPSATVVSAKPFLHGTGTLRCLQKEMATYRHWSVSLWRDPDDVSHCRILSPDKTEWRLISATLCGWRRCFVADQLWFMTRIREEKKHCNFGK